MATAKKTVRRVKAKKEETVPPRMATSLPPMMFQRDERPRLSVVQTLYHQMPGEQPFSHTTRLSQFLAPGSALINQVVSVGEEWQSIPVRMPEEVASILIQNIGPDRPRVVPSQEEVEDIQSRVIEIAYSDAEAPHAQWEVPVGQDMRATPVDPSMLKIRCRNADTKVRFLVSPK